MLSLQASYAAPLILLAQNRQADRDRLAMEEDRRRAAMQKADTEYLAREIAALRIALGEVATRDFLRSELARLAEELDEAAQRRHAERRQRKDAGRRAPDAADGATATARRPDGDSPDAAADGTARRRRRRHSMAHTVRPATVADDRDVAWRACQHPRPPSRTPSRPPWPPSTTRRSAGPITELGMVRSVDGRRRRRGHASSCCSPSPAARCKDKLTHRHHRRRRRGRRASPAWRSTSA